MRKKVPKPSLKLVAVGRAIRRLRIAKGLTRAQLAQRAQLDPRVVTRIESGQQRLRILTVVNLAQALGTTTAKLLRSAKL